MSRLAKITFLRRFLSISFIGVSFVLAYGLAPLLLPLSLLIDLVRRSRFAQTRFYLVLLWLLMWEVIGIVASVVMFLPLLRFWDPDRAAVFRRWNSELVIFWGHNVFWGIRKIYALHLDVRGQAEALKGPVLVFLRHNSVADVFLGNDFIAHAGHLYLRYALKSELRWEPCEDLVVPRAGCVFVERDTDNPEVEIEKIGALGRDLGPHEGVLIYPEGTRYTPKKKQRIIDKLREQGRGEALAYAESLRHVLPPQLGGVLKLLADNEGADLVFCAHLGLESFTKIHDFWDGRIVGSTIFVQFWRIPFAQIPKGKDAQKAFILAQWQEMDARVTQMALERDQMLS